MLFLAHVSYAYGFTIIDMPIRGKYMLIALSKNKNKSTHFFGLVAMMDRKSRHNAPIKKHREKNAHTFSVVHLIHS